MRTKGRYILRGLTVGGLLGLAISISLLVLAFAGLEIKPLIEVVFSPAGVVMLAMKGDNWPGSEPLFVHYLAVVATVAIHALVGAGAGAVVSTVMYGRRPASANPDETA